MLDKPYLQPFKNITISMGLSTNSGVFEPVETKNAISSRLTNDLMYSPIYWNTTRHAWEVSNTTTDVIAGVITESFKFKNIPTRTMVSGIVTMQAGSAIAPGDPVMVSTEVVFPVQVKKATAGNYCIGTALTEASSSAAKAKPEWISVLLGGGNI